MEKAEINDIEQEYERILNTYDKNTIVMLMVENISIENKKKFIIEFHKG